MSIFIGFMFWLHFVAALITLLSIAVLKYPKTIQKTLAQEVIGLVMLLAIACWAGLLHFGLIG
jgi:hypothetical protein